MEVTKAVVMKVGPVVLKMIMKKIKIKKKKILNKQVYHKVVEILVVAVELTQAVELILNQELVKALVDLEMVMDQAKVQDKV